MTTTSQQELSQFLHDERRRKVARVQSDVCLRHSLSTMTRWDCKMEHACDRPPVLKQNQPDLNVGYYTRYHSTSHLQVERWQSSGTANGADRDRPPTLKREKSFGSSSLYNASFPLRSIDDETIELQAVIIAAISSPPPSPKAPPSPSPMVIKKNDPASSCGLLNDHPRQDLMSFLAQPGDSMSCFLPESCLCPDNLARQVSSTSSSHDNMTTILSSAYALLMDDDIDL